MISLTPPPIVFQGDHWSSGALAEIARGWRDAVADRGTIGSRPIAMVMENHPLSVALFFALSALPAPIVLLAPDPNAWHSSPPIPAGTPLVLAPSGHRFAAAGESLGLRAMLLPDPGDRSAAGESPRFMTTPGLVCFSSGSTGAPKPIYRTTANIVAETSAIVSGFGLGPGDAVLGAMPLFRLPGMKHNLLAAALLGSTLGLLERFDYRAVLRLFATEQYRFWSATPVMAEVLGRCPLPAPVIAPSVCAVFTGGLPRRAWNAFQTRFDVPLRGGFGTTESGELSIDDSPNADVRPGTVGKPLHGVRILIGESPDAPCPRGEIGRIWVDSPWYMSGYGFPPDLAPSGEPGAWMPTQDLGRLDEDGYLTVSGRLDDHIKTRSGYLIDPTEVAGVLLGHAGVTDVAVVPLAAPSGSVLGALVECDGPVSAIELRRHASGLLPAWSQPQVLEVTDALPRLVGGKIDRRRCIAILENAR